MATAPKKAGKVMDAVHPGDTPPAPSGRPVIITNRPFMANDPMLSAAEATGVKSEEKPSGDPAPAPADKPKDAPISREAKKVAPLSASSVDAQDSVSDTAEPMDLKEPEVPEAATEQKTAKKVLAPITKQDEPSQKDETSEDDSSEDPEAEVETPQTPEEEAASAREHEIERHIAAGTYAVPIGQAKRRRLAIAFILICALLAALIVLDILLDLDILTLNLPHTNFLNT